MTYKIGFQGKKGAFSYIAAVKYFGENNNFVECENFKNVFEKLVNKRINFGVIPIENTIAGSVYENYDNLSNYKVNIIGEYNLRISHNLLCVPDNKIKSKTKRLKLIKEVYSHPKALEQCNKFFVNKPWIKKVAFDDTAGSAFFVAKQKRFDIAAIASEEAASIYKLQVLYSNIEDNKNNFTRFFIIKRGAPKITSGFNKCSIMFILKHKPGSLYQFLGVFARENINLTKLESRPIIGKPFEYKFFADFILKEKDKKYIKHLFEMLNKNVVKLKVLGFYKSHNI